MEFGSALALVLASSVFATTPPSKPAAAEAEPQPLAAPAAAASGKKD